MGAQPAGDVAGAIAEYQKLTALAPEMIEAHYNLALALVKRDEFDALSNRLGALSLYALISLTPVLAWQILLQQENLMKHRAQSKRRSVLKAG
ncbi:MAG: tetratricopeptide repeat protein [Pyrinomonadaceae bacterium]